MEWAVSFCLQVGWPQGATCTKLTQKQDNSTQVRLASLLWALDSDGFK